MLSEAVLTWTCGGLPPTTTGKRTALARVALAACSAVRLGSPCTAEGGPFRRTAVFNRSTHTIANTDADVWAAIQAEHQRQEDHIELIAS